jgi:hypothetical protein
VKIAGFESSPSRLRSKGGWVGDIIYPRERLSRCSVLSVLAGTCEIVVRLGAIATSPDSRCHSEIEYMNYMRIPMPRASEGKPPAGACCLSSCFPFALGRGLCVFLFLGHADEARLLACSGKGGEGGGGVHGGA